MKKQLQQVTEFHDTFDHPINPEASIPSEKVQQLREELIREELEEFKEANESEDIVAAADALTDLLYVVYGAAICYGLQDVLEDCFEEVHSSNMSKADKEGNPIVREDGKILKGENYFQPNLEEIIF